MKINLQQLKDALFHTHATTKEHAKDQRHYITLMIARIALIFALLRDTRMQKVFRAVFK